MSPTEHITQTYRITATRIFGTLIVFLVLFSRTSWKLGFASSVIIDLIAFAFILIATFGRLWALAYISGNKTSKLIMDGPYSMVRNPLYLFSLIGAIGIGLVSDNVIVLTLIVIMFAFYYPFVIRGEEKRLRKIHGKDFEEYRQNTPMFIPKPSLYREEPLYTIDTRLFRRAFFSVMWFPLIFMIMILIERLHGFALLPVLLTIP